MEILNVKQHTKTYFTAMVTDDYGLEHPIRVRLDSDGTVLFQLTTALRAGGYSNTPISTIRNFRNLGILSGDKATFFDVGPACHAATEQEMLAIIRKSRKTPAGFAGIIREIAQRVRNASPALLTAPEPAPKPTLKASLADQAAGIAWLTTILADTTLPYTLHEQTLARHERAIANLRAAHAFERRRRRTIEETLDMVKKLAYG